jgi:hypothetical protein
MKKIENKTIPYSDQSYGTEPMGLVKFMRTCVLWQLWRFFVLNLKIMKIIVGGHS